MASRSATALFLSSILHAARPTTARASARTIPRAITRSQQPRIAPLLSQRCAHSIPRPPQKKPTTPEASTPSEASSEASTPSENPPKSRVESQPHYRLTFTCTPCNTQSTHNISKQGYHRGSVLVTCPGCRNRHVISDHLKIFGERNITVEDLMREKGQLVKKGTLGEDGDIEFWEDDVEGNKGDFKMAGEPGASAAA
ncbi:hypothetical protein VD0002_g1039 [Verticillium dahliae]|uniref:DNL-type domain-containing protein n=1 Tax=Verticillium dahliae TaxID=27337 RepID=A0AA44W8B9_VERDA|nr:DNL zinc finger domain-containing protein [Verticillium dahliae]PNH26561.1 hypothetical protein BJF96_g10116 [Verticillium dahliae]PNH55383.1 hypothetical protein VD0003_g2213 [Verticillium dahliae]PNH69244.1 hypothetical protein VD0002_g1039 [Verticillium dahliae]